MKTYLLAVAMGATALGGIAFAAQAVPPQPTGMKPGGPMAMRADANNDGVVTRDEAMAPSDRRFDMLDTNHDGRVTRDEFRARANARFALVDTNKDGRIDATERRAVHDVLGGGHRRGGRHMRGPGMGRPDMDRGMGMRGPMGDTPPPPPAPQR